MIRKSDLVAGKQQVASDFGENNSSTRKLVISIQGQHSSMGWQHCHCMKTNSLSMKVLDSNSVVAEAMEASQVATDGQTQPSCTLNHRSLTAGTGIVVGPALQVRALRRHKSHQRKDHDYSLALQAYFFVEI